MLLVAVTAPFVAEVSFRVAQSVGRPSVIAPHLCLEPDLEAVLEGDGDAWALLGYLTLYRDYLFVIGFVGVFSGLGVRFYLSLD